jgi:choline dehydrogenase
MRLFYTKLIFKNWPVGGRVRDARVYGRDASTGSVTMPEDTRMEFDYIVVGAGAAGSVVAGRLSADPRISVLLIEYGGRDLNPLLYVPKGFYYTLRGDRYVYRYETRGHEVWLRGKVLGGSATVNGMMWTRGAQADWDGLAARGNPGWEWKEILSSYRAMEDHSLGASDMRGAGGPLGVSVTDTGDEVTNAILESAGDYGWQKVDDANACDTERIGFTPSTIRNGRRVTSYSAFVRPAKNRKNLTVATRTKAGYLLFDGRRVTGVRARHGTVTSDFTARREVIICAGAVETPLLLERSGIGRGDIIRAIGAEIRVESPHVGERLLEQRGLALQVVLKEDIGQSRYLDTLPKQVLETIKYLPNGRGRLATAGYDLVCQFKSSPGISRPDIHGLFAPLALDTGSKEMKLAKHSGILFMGYPIRSQTRSSVHASGRLPDAPPVIDARFLETEADRAAVAPVLDIVRRVLGQGPVADYIASEEFPGPSVATPEQVIRYSLDTGTGIYHAVGSAAMGPSGDDVVDARLRVRGVAGLRIADASVLPVQVSGNTAAPAMAVGWRAADFILAGT